MKRRQETDGEREMELHLGSRARRFWLLMHPKICQIRFSPVELVHLTLGRKKLKKTNHKKQSKSTNTYTTAIWDTVVLTLS